MTQLSPLATLNRSLTVFGEALEDLNEVRAKIKALKDERTKLERLPVTKAEATARGDAWLDRICGREDGPMPSHMPPLHLFTHREVSKAVELPTSDREFRRCVMTFVRPQVSAYLAEYWERFYKVAGLGIASEVRQAKLAEMDEELLGLEATEEALIRGAARMNISLMRRDDADGRVLLTADESLPSIT
ncbi:hypothetical protein [Methyloceanibacter sp.]|uniref:hypothetical protein n=1 Tax=Methyloceanibacter sp. TaxID=1965321 RepID=UPI002BB7A269|nr:hypothetical protein [Methyloceanibacter sp.]HML93248.1 hypothetical protein [Methyloceanibacter sp.]